MKPIAIFRHAPTEGPGSLSTYLDRHGLTQTLIRVDAGDPVPSDPTRFAGLAFMGGPMSVNDDLPWIAPEIALIRAAVDADVPLIGHCLGGQLMSKALGGQVTRNPVWEIGWRTVAIEPNPMAQSWFGPTREFLSFHWHGETFTIPAGATRLASSDLCGNQAFAIGPHLALQCHVEMTPELIRTWLREGAADLVRHAGPGVQSNIGIEVEMEERVARLATVATRLYDRWIAGLAP